jgi:magnesium transporter
MASATLTSARPTYLLSEIIGLKARLNGKTIGRLHDVVVAESGKVPEVTYLLISRAFGHRSLMVPWSKVAELDPQGQVSLAIEAFESYEGEPDEGQICLRDHLLDKKVLDCDDDEVEVVYDIKLTARNGHLYVTDVDCSRAGLLRRIGLSRLSKMIRNLAASLAEDTIPWTYVQPLPANMGSFRGNVKLNVLKAKLPEIHPVDLADILEEVEQADRMAIFNQLETEQAADTLEEVEPRVQREMVAALPVPRVAELLNDMTPAQAADVLAVLPGPNIDAILEKIDAEEASKIRLLLEKHEDHVLSFATSHYVTFPPQATVKQVMRRYRKAAKEADVVIYIYVTSADGTLLGVLDIKDLLKAELSDPLDAIMVTNVVALHEDDTVRTAAKLFSRYGFRALPIVGAGDVLKGVIPFRDLMLAQRLV